MSYSYNFNAPTLMMHVDDIMVPAQGRLLVGRNYRFSLVMGFRVIRIKSGLFLAFPLVRPSFPIWAFLSFMGNAVGSLAGLG